jgi:hypothetical protein
VDVVKSCAAKVAIRNGAGATKRLPGQGASLNGLYIRRGGLGGWDEERRGAGSGASGGLGEEAASHADSLWGLYLETYSRYHNGN